MQELHHRLLSDLEKIGISADFTLELKPYSKIYYGRYDPNTNKVILYVYRDKGCSQVEEYKDLLMSLIHESVHYLQWTDKSFVRRKGVMHNAEFYHLFNKYRTKAEILLQEVI